MTVLVVEDDSSVARFVLQAVSEAGYTAEVVGDGRAALQRAVATRYDLILLDVMLPGMNGFEVCRQLRAQNVTSLILIITARDEVEEIIQGLDAGADDYIAKPFQVAELLARMRALGRRTASSSTVLRIADLTLDPLTRQAQRADREISLTATEYSLLEYLMRNPNCVLTRSNIVDHVWAHNFTGNENVLDVYIAYLRKKIDHDQQVRLIHNVRGVGFCIGVRDEG